MKNIDVILFVEHKDRELEIAIELQALLLSEGVTTVILSSVYHMLTALRKYRPKAIVTPSTALGKGSVGYNYYQIYGDQIMYFNLNFEQFISSWKGKYKNSKHPAFTRIQRQFVWGEYFKEILIDSGVNNDNIVVTGRPYNELVRKKYVGKKVKYRNELIKSHDIPQGNTLIMVALTDGLAYVTDDKIKYMISNGAIENDLRDHVDYVKRNVNHIFQHIHDLIMDGTLKKNNITIILRPHPAIPNSHYLELLKLGEEELENVIVTKSENALKWLTVADAFITNYSTLAIEAKNIGTPIYLHEVYKKEINENYWWINNCELIDSYESFVALLDKNHNNTNRAALNLDETKYFIDDSLEPFHIRTVYINEQVKNRLPPRFEYGSILPLVINAGRRIFGSSLRNMLMKYNMGMTKPGIRSDYFSEKDIFNEMA